MRQNAPTKPETVALLQKHGLRLPKMLTIAVTGACNLTCSHCFVDAGTVSSPGHVPIETIRQLFRAFRAIGGRGVRITGGEPFCHPELPDILKRAREEGFESIALQTNAMLVRDEVAAALRELAVPELSIQVSLDGASAESHDFVRGAGSFAAALAGIRRLVDNGLGGSVSIFMTEMRHNVAEIPALLELAEELGVDSVTTGALVACGRAAKTHGPAPAELFDYLALLERFDSDRRFRELYRKLGTVAAIEWRTGTTRTESCTFAENPYISVTGTLYPCLLCHAAPYSVSGVFEKGLTAAFAEAAPLWSELAAISRRRAEEIRHCHGCPAKPTCAGGCMGRAWGSCNDLMAPDDRCAVRRVIARHRLS